MRIILCAAVFLYGAVAASQSASQPNVAHPLYLGLAAGYGSTTWQGLVPSTENQNMAISISTPISVQEGGGVWGLFAGYEFSPYFALEANYMRYPSATIFFDENSLFAFEHDGRLDLHTNTQTGSIVARVMLMIPNTTIRAYSSAGVAEIYRWDELNENQRITPTFGFGFNYNVTEHVMVELGANYTAGYGESELNPAIDFVPFLYAGFLKLAYRI